MSSFNYVSCVRIGGQPILPPIIYPADRPLLQKYREAAIQKEKEIKERSLSRRASLGLEISGEETDDSLTSQTSVKTAQVMWFIRQALKNVGVNAEEVKSLQSQIFQELNDLQKSNSCDTLHNFEDSSVFASTSVEVSPEKPDRSVGDCDRFRNESYDDHFENSLSLPLPDSPRGDRIEATSVTTPPFTPTKLFATSPSNAVEEVTPHLIRRNSYTLSSPSPGVLSCFKSMAKAPDSQSPVKATCLSSVKRNLNEVWSTPDASPFDDNVQVFDFDRHFKMSRSAEASRTTSENANTIVHKPFLEDNDASQAKRELAAAKIQAGVRGYLTRRLLRTARVMELKNSIKDSLMTALELFTDPEVKDKNELEFRKHLTLQVERFCDEWHSVIIDSTPQERMKIIRLDRHKIERQRLSKSVPKRPVNKKPAINDNKSLISRSLGPSLKSHVLRTSSDTKGKRFPTTDNVLSKSMPSSYRRGS